nr:MAG TPA: hypothetical protein [Caudoviricetes sp.]
MTAPLGMTKPCIPCPLKRQNRLLNKYRRITVVLIASAMEKCTTE